MDIKVIHSKADYESALAAGLKVGKRRHRRP